MVGLVEFILYFAFLNNLSSQRSLKEVLQWVRMFLHSVYTVIYRERVKVFSLNFIVVSSFLFQLSISLCLQCWVLEGNAHAVLISLCWILLCVAALGCLLCFLRKKAMEGFSRKIIWAKTREREKTQMEIKSHGKVGFRKEASCVVEDLMEVSTRQSRNSSGMQ